MQAARRQRYGQAVQAYREQRQWNQRQLADHLGYGSDSMISAIEAGTTEPALEKALEIARLFETTIEAMCAYNGTLPQAPGAAAASGLGGFELLLPARQGKISVTGWTVEHATQLLRVLKEVGFPFDGNAVVHELPGMNGGLEPEGGPSDAAVA